jgi:hypothetical protein
VLLRMHAGPPELHDQPLADGLFAAIDEAAKSERFVEKYGHKMGIDEVLSGRAGLLTSILDLPPEQAKAFQPLLPNLIDTIVQAGISGAEAYATDRMNYCLPLMWSWIDGFYSLGW